MDLELEALLEAQFELRGEAVCFRGGGPVRISLGKRDGYARVNVKGTKRRMVLYHRLKFFLFFGWLPPFVDHRSRDRSNNDLENLRPATKQQNGWNAKQRVKKNGITSRGVFFRKDCPAAPYQARAGRKTLGYFATEAEASEAVEASLRAKHGAFYRDPTD